MGCDCGKPKCDGHCGVSPAVLQINNPSECVLFHRVEVPASMGDSKTNPPKSGAYKNVLLYYEADQTSWLYSSDGIPQKLVNGLTNYEDAINLPQINGVTLLGNKSLGDLGITDAIDDAVAEEKAEREAADEALGDEIDIINDELLSRAVVFDTVADMKAATNLVNGSYAQTLGFHSVNDGGGALYKISDTGTADEMFTIAVGSLYADLVYTNEIETLQIGIKNDSSEDISSKLNVVTGNTKVAKLVFTKGNYTVNNTINIDRKIELDLNGSTITYTKENDVLFDISTHYNIKPIIRNGYIIGTDTNTCFNIAEYDNGSAVWGASVNLYDLDVRRFNKIFHALNIFNCEISDCIFSTNGTYEIGVSDNSLMSNANCFKNCYFKAYSTQATYPTYSFILNTVVNLNFISCSFEQMTSVINNTNCRSVKFSNCEFEQISGVVAKSTAGIILDNSNALLDITKTFESVDYKYVPTASFESNFVYSDDNNAATLRYKLRNATNKIPRCRSLMSTADGTNSVPDISLEQGKWDIHKPLNIVRNDSTEAGTKLSTPVSSPIFNSQQNESHILTIYTIIYGSSSDYQVWRSTWIEINNTTFVNAEVATCIKDASWTGSSLKDNTLSETLTQNTYTATTSKQYATLSTIIKYEHVGNKLR